MRREDWRFRVCEYLLESLPTPVPRVDTIPISNNLSVIHMLR